MKTKEIILLVMLVIMAIAVNSTELQFPKTDFDTLTLGGGYDAGGITLYGTNSNKGSGFFANDILIAGDIISISDFNLTGNIVCAVDGTCNVGNGSNRMKDANFSGRIESGALTVDGNMLYVDSVTDRVGIGTTTPTYTLEVIGNVSADYFFGSGARLSDLNVTGTAVFNTSTITENLTIIDLTDTYKVIISGTTIYSNTEYAPLLQLGGSSLASKNYAVAIGLGAISNSTSGIAIGDSSHAYSTEGMAFGSGSTAYYRAIALGYQATAKGDYSSALGWAAQALGTYATAIGYQVKASGANSLAMGQGSRAEGDYSVSIGRLTNASGDDSYAWGYNVTTKGANSYGFGSNGSSSSSDVLMLHNLDLIVEDGNVGIGTAAPLGKLHVQVTNQSLQATALSVNEVVAFEGDDINLELASSGGGTWGSALSLVDIGADGALDDKWGLVRETFAAGSDLRITYGTYREAYNNPSLMTILKTGNVGIGTTGPTHKLHVVGSENLTGTLYYGVLQAQSPHTLIERDSKGNLKPTSFCIVTTTGNVLQFGFTDAGIPTKTGLNTTECMNKEILESSIVNELNQTILTYKKVFTNKERNVTEVNKIQ